MRVQQKTLKDLFIDQLKDIYFAEKQIYKTLPKLIKAAESSELKKAFTEHRVQTEDHIKRLESVFEMLGKSPQAKTCEAIKGIMTEGDETIEEYGESEAIDAGLVASGQAVEHYEMARYGTLIAWAKQMAMPAAAKLFAETLQEEKAADELLSKIGLGAVNKKAAAA
jgi:ferritin-like metal-binding protein YciE